MRTGFALRARDRIVLTMSTTHDSPEYACSRIGCTETFPQAQAVSGSFCSTICDYQHRGRKILQKIRSDHRFCATCFKPIKEVEFPSERWEEAKTSKMDLALDCGATFEGGNAGQLVIDATECPDDAQPTAADAVIGEQYPTAHTDMATDVDEPDDDTWQRDYRGRWSCECGTIDPQHREDALAKAEGGTVLLDLLRTLWTLEADGVISQRASKDRLFAAFRDRPGDWEFAIGRTLYD